MSDLLRIILRWLILIFIIILVIALIIRFANKNNATNKTLNSGVKTVQKVSDDTKKTVKENVEEVKNNTTDTTKEEKVEVKSDQVVESPDTATSDTLSIILGLLIIGGSTYYIYYNGKKINA